MQNTPILFARVDLGACDPTTLTSRGVTKVTTTSEQPEIVYLLDASIYIFQSHFSPYVECRSTEGTELSAFYGFTLFLLQFLRRVKPTHLAIAHDASLFCGFRHELSPDYKSNRELPDENLAMQLQACSEICGILGLISFVSKVYEADDIIGTMASNVRQESDACAIHIVSRDKDLAQLLVSKQDCLWDYSGNIKRFSTDIMNDYGVWPEQFTDYLGLVGDSVDCISGVPGVGPVKARALLEAFGSVEGIYRNLDKVGALSLRGAARLPDILEANRESAELSKLLATIVCDVSDDNEAFSNITLETLLRGRPDLRGLESFLAQYCFSGRDLDHILSQARQLG